MARSKIGFITGNGGNPTGIGSFVHDIDEAGIPAVIMANDADTGISDALSLVTDVDHVLLFRVVRDGTEEWSVPDYDKEPVNAAGSHWNKIRQYFPPSIVANKSKVWIQPINEVDKNKADWLGKFGVEFAKIANQNGYKVAMFGWASGTPEPSHWREPGMVSYLQYCHSNPDMAGIALHEYDYGLIGMEKTFPYHIGRFLELFAACDELSLNRPKVLISEFGWAYTSIPGAETCMEDIDYAARLYAQHDEVLGAGIWYLGPGFSDIADEVNQLIEPVKQYNIETELEGPPDIDEAINWLANPSFELGWYHPDNIPELQIPNDWMFWYATDDLQNPYDDEEWSVWRRPEVRTLPKSALPPNEQNLFVLDGEYTLKVFKGNGSIWHSWFQQLPSPGSWRFEINAFPDIITGYNQDGSKIFATDQNSCIVWMELGDGQVSEELRPEIGQWNKLVFDIKNTSSTYFDIHFMQPFAVSNNGLFLDNWSLKDMGSGCEPVDPYKRVVWVYPPDITEEQYLTLSQQAWQDGRRTLTGSYDDAGIGCGLISKTAVLFGIDEDLHGTFEQWYLDRYPGTLVEFRPLPPTP